MRIRYSIIFYWLPFAVTAIILAGLVYVVVQQTLRQSANDPQIQIAQDYAGALSKGEAQASALVPSIPTVEISASLSPFLAIYSATGTPVGSSSALDSKLPSLPANVFVTALKKGEYRFTWQPKKDLRVAAVIAPYSSADEKGFVMVGRPLTETDMRIKQLAVITAAATALAWLLGFLAMWLAASKTRPEEAAAEPAPQHYEHHS